MELINLAILMLYPLPFDKLKVTAKGLTKNGLHKIEEAGPLMV
jgi:hypothetical protein